MKTHFLMLGLALLTGPAYAQIPAVVSAPLAEGISRKQTTHQTLTTAQMLEGKGLAAKMTAVSGQIKGVMDKTQQLHETWYNSLLQISNGVRNYRRVKEIYDGQSDMIKHYSTAHGSLVRQGLTFAQLDAAGKTYGALLRENVGLLEELITVLSAGQAKMTDPERLEFINHIADRMIEQRELMTYFTSKCQALARQQRQSSVDAQALNVLVGGK